MASPLSPGSNCSFHTAPSSPAPAPLGPLGPLDSDVDMSDAPHDVESAPEIPKPLSQCKYRPGVPINEDIRQHCHIYLDEQLYGRALTLLSDLVTSGASHPDAHEKPTYVPIPYHIELVSILLIHPNHTNHSPPSERLAIASRAITFLRNTLRILGPVNANLVEAFSLSPFVSARTSRRSRNTAEFEDGTSGSDSDEKYERMRGVIANKGRIRTCAKDFWHIVGWAFNCSVEYPKRWQYWKVYLDYMLDVLDEDWQERQRQDEASTEGKLSECEYEMLRKGLLVKYLSEVKGRSSVLKRVVRSVFADGEPDSLREFPEVFQNETKEVVHNGQKRKRADTMEVQFGDYDDDEPELVSSPMQDDEDDDDEYVPPDADPYLGGTDSIALRQRILTLFSRVAFYLPDEFIDITELYEVIVSNLKTMPIPAFSLIMSPSKSSEMKVQVFVSLANLMLLRCFPPNAPRLYEVTGSDDDNITQEVLEQCFLPYSAHNASTHDNAKVSILVEGLFRLYLRECLCSHTSALEQAVGLGILARENKIKKDKIPKDLVAKKRQDVARELLKASGERLRSLLAFVKRNSPSTPDSD